MNEREKAPIEGKGQYPQGAQSRNERNSPIPNNNDPDPWDDYPGPLVCRLQATVLTCTVFGIKQGSHLGDAVQFFAYDTPKVMMLLTLIVFVVGMIRSFFTQHRTSSRVCQQPQPQDPPQLPWARDFARDCTTSRLSASLTAVISMFKEMVSGWVRKPRAWHRGWKMWPKNSWAWIRRRRK